MSHYVKCYYCGQTFNRDKEPFVKVNERRYAHTDCSLVGEKQLTQEEQDKEHLEVYIKKLLKLDNLNPRIRRQIKEYKEEYNYTYSGMERALIYFYEVKGNDIEKANGGIGIIPYVYNKAFNYYYAIWEAQQRNREKVLQDYVPTIKEVKILKPKRKTRKSDLFTFLDEEDKEGL